VEERGSAYLPQVNAFHIREFQMMYAAEDATRFLHHACRGLPQRLNGHSTSNGLHEGALTVFPGDVFYMRVIEHAVAYFGSRVLYPARPAPEMENPAALSRAAIEKAAQAAIRSDAEKFESIAQDCGYRIGSQIYDAYLAGKVKQSALRRLFLVHLDQPGLAHTVCAAVIAKLRSVAKT
jgi:hypothetical protein